MARVKRHVELDEVHLNFFHSRFPGTSLSYILNEMLFHLHNTIMENDVSLGDMLKEATQRTIENSKH